jgi:hypothetical protein
MRVEEVAEVRKKLWVGVPAVVTGLCLLSYPGTSQAKTQPAISPGFIAKVNAYCSAEQSRFNQVLGQFPYPSFDPLHPDVTTMRLVGKHFEQGLSLRNAIPSQLKALGEPQAGKSHWDQLESLANQINRTDTTQVRVALAGNVKGFVTTVNQNSSEHNELVKTAEKDGFAKSSPCGDLF